MTAMEWHNRDETLFDERTLVPANDADGRALEPTQGLEKWDKQDAMLLLFLMAGVRAEVPEERLNLFGLSTKLKALMMELLRQKFKSLKLGAVSEESPVRFFSEEDLESLRDFDG